MKSRTLIILEDNPLFQASMKAHIPSGIQCVIVETSAELAKILSDTTPVDVFALDDNVPPISGAKPIRAFLENAVKVKESFPEATIVYIGSAPDEPEIKYCKKHSIPMVDKLDLAFALK